MAENANQSNKQGYTLPLKVLVDKETNKVLFAEAGKDFVDVLLSFLTLPMGTIARLVAKDSNWDCVRKERGNLLSTFKNKKCHCGKPMDREISLEERTSENGFVKETASFIICDDLRVMPNSLGTSVDLFHELGAKNMEAIEERTVEIGNKELLDLLKCSFLSKTPLTDFILNKKQFLYVYTKHQCQFEIGEVSSNVIRQMVLKVLIRKSDRKILFVEGQEDFADFIFGFLTLPLGGVLHMLGVFLLTLQSLFDFMGNFIKQWILLILSPLMENQILEDVIGPAMYMVTDDLVVTPILSISGVSYLNRSKVRLSDLEQRVINIGLKECLSILKASLISTSALTNGLEKFIMPDKEEWYISWKAVLLLAAYMDDLVVTRMSSICVMSLLQSMSIPVSDLAEKVVSIGIKEGVRMLRASLTSTSALTIGLNHLLTKAKEENWSKYTEGFINLNNGLKQFVMPVKNGIRAWLKDWFSTCLNDGGTYEG
ncbi:uncharacterized protein LOC114397329 [Glycine soja]|uniref:uncharacterized protein LOC114397329 n=1 Tax=Glycine soja TaxID=3848 RepID=UPI00103F5543|nr:uncharacterized protein LOC114397329 [Glycine soja]